MLLNYLSVTIYSETTLKRPKICALVHIFQTPQVVRIGVFAGSLLDPWPYV